MKLKICLQCTKEGYRGSIPKRSKSWIRRRLKDMKYRWKKQGKMACDNWCHWFNVHKLPPPQCQYYLEQLVTATPYERKKQNVVTWLREK